MANSPRISMIAAMAQNNVIGNGDDIPWHIPEDFKYFKEKTLDKPVIMGRATFESIHKIRGSDPDSGPALPKRTNIIITRQENYKAKDCFVSTSIEDAIAQAKLELAEEIMIIGGGTIYEQALPFADYIYLTEIDGDYKGDVFFPELSPSEWQKIKSEKKDGFSFNEYGRI